MSLVGINVIWLSFNIFLKNPEDILKTTVINFFYIRKFIHEIIFTAKYLNIIILSPYNLKIFFNSNFDKFFAFFPNSKYFLLVIIKFKEE